MFFRITQNKITKDVANKIPFFNEPLPVMKNDAVVLDDSGKNLRKFVKTRISVKTYTYRFHVIFPLFQMKKIKPKLTVPKNLRLNLKWVQPKLWQN